MALATIISLPDSKCRGLTFLPQQFSGWIPAGEYDVGRECELAYSEFSKTCTGRAVPLVNIATGDKWYVGATIAGDLVDCFRREPGRFPE